MNIQRAAAQEPRGHGRASTPRPENREGGWITILAPGDLLEFLFRLGVAGLVECLQRRGLRDLESVPSDGHLHGESTGDFKGSAPYRPRGSSDAVRRERAGAVRAGGGVTVHFRQTVNSYCQRV